MDPRDVASCTAFADDRKIASGAPREVARTMRETLDRAPGATLRAFDDATARPVEFDLRGLAEEVVARLEPPARRPGRPKLGVIAREVTLLPRHWDWLAEQPGGASIALRRLVERARAEGASGDAVRAAQEAAYRFMAATVGDLPGFEEATRALFARDDELFGQWSEVWPADLRAHARRLAERAFRP